MRTNIRVVATDGIVTKKILWIKRTPQHMCYGWDVPGDVGHFTYHNSGKVHYKMKGRIIGDTIQKIPLKNFRNRVQVGNGGFNKNLNNLPNVDFDYKKVNGMVWIDTRTFTDPKRDCINIDLQLIEPEKLGLAYFWPNYQSMHVFTFFNPWVIVSIG